VDQDTKTKTLSESIEFLADFQLLFGNIIRINGAFLEVAEKVCSEDELITVPIWRVIAVIRINPMTVSDVAKYLGIKRQSVQSTVNQMKVKGLINFRKNPNHKTSPLVILTKKGNDKVDDILRYQKKLTEVFIDGIKITMKDVVSSREFLRALRENSEKNISKLN
jgi:DNA-binding MarR family transcriptional regulator|tara:strand:- start:3679 stop:4173 length:495 start_codon:yes stop_codon:yes gene_type:complete